MASRFMKKTTRPLRSKGHPSESAGAKSGGGDLKDSPVGYKPAGSGSSTHYNRATKVPIVKSWVAGDGLSCGH